MRSPDQKFECLVQSTESTVIHPSPRTPHPQLFRHFQYPTPPLIDEEKKREAMELLARHTVDQRGTLRPLGATSSASGVLHEQLSWVAIPMGRCSEPTNVRAGGQACPIRYQCAACPHFESDPSYLPELHTYADDLRKERETMLAAGAAAWAVENVERQISVIGGHITQHEETLASLPAEERTLLEDASATVRKARQSVPVAFGRRREGDRD